ncbi:ester cyclase [Amycolatopsis sp. CA-230715]|uniref:ester cyclase n=1 Tax=Amycolatopsis sp. CA-230715 TaxID=2745196 RepID=UPI001C00B1F0|nr:ester cyclase [Amycolatopsis sp. CA-230715]QWF79575.1 hypothetical protein HUW46_02984 [Amycolatopsis sp. CA-230715]
MSQEQELIRRFVAMVDAHDLSDLHEVLTEDVTEAGPIVVDAPSGGLDAFRAGWQMMLGSFPDLAVTIDETVAEPGKVAATISLRATNTGHYRRGEATGRHARWRGFVIAHVRDGRISRFDAMTDRFGMLQQLGIVGDDDELAAPRQASHHG